MSVACAAEDCGRYLWESDTSNKSLEWTGRHQRSASRFLSLPATQGQRSKDRAPRNQAICTENTKNRFGPLCPLLTSVNKW